MDWHSCIDDKNAIKMTSNSERIKSLLHSAKRRKDFVENHKIDDTNAEIIFSDMYEGCLELLHAFVAQKGYKVQNHICLAYFLRDNENDRELFMIFDRYRKIRNDVLYYGRMLDKGFSIKAIQELSYFYQRIKGKIIM
ncbi:hypothetical protein J4232_01325 [Candidatus Woesearchaeota archaeon]|nr:hypothetical protein [Candidatus Woesearchaeota archaeon]